MRAPRIATGLLVQALAAVIAGCGGGGSSSSPPTPAPAPAPAPTPTPTPTPTPAPTPTPTSGLDARPSNTTCLAGDPPSGVAIDTQRVFANLPDFTQPILMLQAPGSAARWYVVQKTGQVRVFDNSAGVSSASTFIDISAQLNSDPSSPNDERGLLGMAFHPNYPTDPRVYL
jgi:hypothetical protein